MEQNQETSPPNFHNFPISTNQQSKSDYLESFLYSYEKGNTQYSLIKNLWLISNDKFLWTQPNHVTITVSINVGFFVACFLEYFQ